MHLEQWILLDLLELMACNRLQLSFCVSFEKLLIVTACAALSFQ